MSLITPEQMDVYAGRNIRQGRTRRKLKCAVCGQRGEWAYVPLPSTRRGLSYLAEGWRYIYGLLVCCDVCASKVIRGVVK